MGKDFKITVLRAHNNTLLNIPTLFCVNTGLYSGMHPILQMVNTILPYIIP